MSIMTPRKARANAPCKPGYGNAGRLTEYRAGIRKLDRLKSVSPKYEMKRSRQPLTNS